MEAISAGTRPHLGDAKHVIGLPLQQEGHGGEVQTPEATIHVPLLGPPFFSWGGGGGHMGGGMV